MMLAWFLLVQFSLADLQVGHRLYVSYVAFDHSLRVPLVEAAAGAEFRLGILFTVWERLPVLRYFYYWYVVCALPMRLFGLSAKACFNASVFWSGLGLASTIPLFLKYFLGETEHLRRKSVIGIALLTVTGLDLIPYAVHGPAIITCFSPDMEWWDRTRSPPGWARCCGCRIMWRRLRRAWRACSRSPRSMRKLRFAKPSGLLFYPGLAFASAAGLSVYVTFAFAVFAILWALLTLRAEENQDIRCLCRNRRFLAAALLAIPVGLAFQTDAGATGDRVRLFRDSRLSPALELLGKAWIAQLLGCSNLAKLPILLFVYVLEFGFFALIMAAVSAAGLAKSCSAQPAAPHGVDDVRRLPADVERPEIGHVGCQRSGIQGDAGGAVCPADMVGAHCP